MVARFLKGIDPVYEEYLNDLFEQTMSKFARQVVSAVNRQPGISMKRTALDPIATKLAKEMLEEAIERKEREYDTSILNMVEFMPKQELAHLAQSLIDVTALKRRVSTQRETVGGEVDVAVISKSEGLVWIRRKHYFPPDLNPRFYKRHYNQKVDHENV